jgi:hypothetical protein
MVDDLRIPGRWHLGEPLTDESRDPSEFTVGRPSQISSVPNIDIDIPGVALDFTLTTRIVPVASKQLAQVVSKFAGDTVQRIPVTISGHEGYEILNIVRSVDCLDESRSEYTKWREADERPDLIGHYRMVSVLHIDTSRVPSDLHIFRIKWWNVALVVSSELVRAVKSGHALGPKFSLID